MRFVRSLLLPLALLVLGTGVANAHEGYAHEPPKADDGGLTYLSSGVGRHSASPALASLSAALRANVLAGRDPQDALEVAREMAMVGEAHRGCHCSRRLALLQKPAAALYANVHLVGVGR